jgi:MFS family permease
MRPATPSDDTPALSLTRLLVCAALVVTLSMGIRHGFGLWMAPVSQTHGWSRETFSFALAIQNLVWGFAGPVVGWWADRKGAVGVLLAGGLLYALGLWGMASATTPLVFTLTTGVVIGIAQACSTYPVVYGILGRHVSASQRAWAMSITAAAGSFGQFLMVPAASHLLAIVSWQEALWYLSVACLLMWPLAWLLRADKPVLASSPGINTPKPATHASQSTWEALKEAATHPSYLLLTAGYFVCGFQLAFIGIHLPSYLRDQQLAASVATTALALIGLFNVVGTYSVGWMGQRFSKPYLLSAIYIGRALAMTVFVLTPASPWSVAIFSAVMGFLWLSTVPPTNAIVAQMMGVKHLSMLAALVFLSHQLGSFMGVWLGGWLYDLQGHYQWVWWIAIALGVVAAALNLPIREHAPPKGRLSAITP